MSMKLYVGGLSWGTTDSTLRQAFEVHGSVLEANIITDRMTGKSRGFGFVTYSDQSSAEAAISEMNGQELDGRSVTVSVAQERSRSDRGSFDRDYSQDRRGGGSKKGQRNRW